MKIAPSIDGSIVRLSVELSREEVDALGCELPQALAGAAFVVTLDVFRLGPRFTQVLKSKSKRTQIEGGAIEIRTAGDRPVRGAEPATVRDRGPRGGA